MTERVRCNAKSKSTGVQCKQYAVPGSSKCRFHGGLTPRGLASPHFKTGKHVRHPTIPVRLMEHYQASLSDPHLVELRSEIALIDARLAELLTRVDTGQAEQLWKDMRQAHDDARKAWGREDYAGLEAAFTNMDRAIGAGLTDYAAWTEVGKLVEQRRKLAESEQKRLITDKQVVAAEQVAAAYVSLAMAIKEEIVGRVDEKTARDILSGVQRRIDILASSVE